MYNNESNKSKIIRIDKDKDLWCFSIISCDMFDGLWYHCDIDVIHSTNIIFLHHDIFKESNNNIQVPRRDLNLWVLMALTL